MNSRTGSGFKLLLRMQGRALLLMRQLGRQLFWCRHVKESHELREHLLEPLGAVAPLLGVRVDYNLQLLHFISTLLQQTFLLCPQIASHAE